MGVCVPQSSAARARTSSPTCSCSRSSRARDAGRRRHGRRPHQRGHAADARPRHASRSRLVPPLAQGHELAAFALTESGAGSDASAMLTPLARRPPHAARSSGSPTARTPTSSSSSPRGPRAAERVHRPPRAPHGFAVTREEEKLGLNSSSTADLAFEETPAERLGLPGAGMRIALRRSTAGASASPRRRSGSPRRRSTSRTPTRRSARAFGKPIGAASGDPAEARRHADRDRGGARADLARRAAEGRRAPAHRRGRAGQALRLARSRGARPARRSRSSAATATPASSRPSATTATRRSPRSTRARARSSAS